MATGSELQNERSARPDARELKTLTLRIASDVHEQIERAARICDQSLNQFITEAAQDAAKRTIGDGLRERTALAALVDLDAFSAKPLINVEALERAIASIGRPIVKCSYSSFGATNLDQSRHLLLTRHYRHEELPSREALRLRLTAEAVQLVGAGIVRDFVIVSADEEFGFVASLLARQGASVTGIGLRPISESSPDFIRAFESFRPYDQIDQPPASDELRGLQARYVESMIQAVQRLENRGAKAVGAALIPILQDRHPELSLELLELRSWREFAEIGRELGLVAAVEPSGSDFLVRLTDSGRTKAGELLADSDARSAQLGEIANIRHAVAEILGIELPDLSTRFLIFNATVWVLNEEMIEGGISLVDLSYRVVARLGEDRIPQNTVYRLLNGLYRCGVFEFIPNPANDYDPFIRRARCPVTDFDDAFVLNLMRSRRKFPHDSRPEDVSTVFYQTPSYSVKVLTMLKFATDPGIGRADLPDVLTALRQLGTI